MPEVVDSFRNRKEYWSTELSIWHKRSLSISKKLKVGSIRKFKGYHVNTDTSIKSRYKKQYINTLHYYFSLYYNKFESNSKKKRSYVNNDNKLIKKKKTMIY